MNIDRYSIGMALVLGGLVTEYACTTARGDGGTPRFHARREWCEITVFTAPSPLRVGPVDISVFLQDAGSGAPLPEARVLVTAAPRGRPGRVLRGEATSHAATNKLLRSALFELPEEGWWDVEITVHGGVGTKEREESFRFPLEAAGRLPLWLALWSWFAWPAVAVGLFALRQHRLREHRPSC